MEDKEGNRAADMAADLGRPRLPELVIDARRKLLRVKGEWYSRMLVLHRFMVAVSRKALDHVDGRRGGARALIPWLGIMVLNLRLARTTADSLRILLPCLVLLVSG